MAKKKTLRDLISPIKKIIDTVRPLKGNKIITDKDRVTPSELSTIVATTSRPGITIPSVIDKNTLSPNDANILMSEETIRRRIAAERRIDVEEAYKDEKVRRGIHTKIIQLKKDEFQLFLKNKYPFLVGQRHIQENNFKVNKVVVPQTFFEDIFKQEYVAKTKLNPEILGLSDIELRKNQIAKLEEELGIKIIPHRHMMETPNGIVLIKERITPNS